MRGVVEDAVSGKMGTGEDRGKRGVGRGRETGLATKGSSMSRRQQASNVSSPCVPPEPVATRDELCCAGMTIPASTIPSPLGSASRVTIPSELVLPPREMFGTSWCPSGCSRSPVVASGKSRRVPRGASVDGATGAGGACGVRRSGGGVGAEGSGFEGAPVLFRGIKTGLLSLPISVSTPVNLPTTPSQQPWGWNGISSSCATLDKD